MSSAEKMQDMMNEASPLTEVARDEMAHWAHGKPTVAIAYAAIAQAEAAERQAVALERIAAALEADGLVDKPLQTSALIRIAAALERIVGQMEQRP